MSRWRFVGYYLALTVCCVIAFPRWAPTSAVSAAVGRSEGAAATDHSEDSAGAAAARPYYDVVCVLAKRVNGLHPANVVVLTAPSGRPVFARYDRRLQPGALPSIYFCRHIIDLSGPTGHPLGSHPLEVHAQRRGRNGALQLPDAEASLLQHLDEMGRLSESVRTIVVLPSHA